jgi:hypothetical protein
MTESKDFNKILTCQWEKSKLEEKNKKIHYLWNFVKKARTKEYYIE